MNLRVSWMSPWSKDGGGSHVRGAKRDWWETNRPDCLPHAFTLPVFSIMRADNGGKTFWNMPATAHMLNSAQSRSTPNGHKCSFLSFQQGRKETHCLVSLQYSHLLKQSKFYMQKIYNKHFDVHQNLRKIQYSILHLAFCSQGFTENYTFFYSVILMWNCIVKYSNSVEYFISGSFVVIKVMWFK